MTGSGLVAVKRSLAAFLEAQAVDVVVRIGWRERGRIDNQADAGAGRIVLAPGVLDPSTGVPKALAGGTLSRDAPEQFLQSNPSLRALGWWKAAVTVCVWAVDPQRPNDEEAQIEATENLFEVAVQGLHNGVDPLSGQATGFANIEEWGDVIWTLPPVEQSFGRELCFSLVLCMPLFDVALGVAFPGGAVARNPTS